MPARYAAVDSADLLGGRADEVRIGYASRESNRCKSGRDCGGTVSPYHACCPEDTKCVSLDLNARCCKTSKDCLSSLEEVYAQCANEEHDMYYNDGYFCCEQWLKGYMDSITEGNGCGDEDYVLKKDEDWLEIVKAGKPTSGASSKTTGAPSATNPGNTSKTTGKSSATNPSQTSRQTSSNGTSDPSGTTTTGINGSSTIGSGSPTNTAPSAGAPSSTDGAGGKTASNTGAIAGGVVGGIAALALIAVLLWFLRRRKARSYASTTPASPSGGYHAVEGQGPEKDVPIGAMAAKSGHQAEGSVGGVSELPAKDKGGDLGAAELYGPGGKRVAEVYSPGGQGPAEMYSPSVATTAELNGVERGPGELPAWDERGVPAQLKVGDGKPGPVELP